MASFSERDGKLFIDGKEVLRGWESRAGWFWFATDYAGKQDSVINGEVYYDDTIWFGLVQGFQEEWGEFSETELRLMSPAVWEIRSEDLPRAGRRGRHG